MSHLITVTHPHVGFGRHASKQFRFALHRDAGSAVFARRSILDSASQSITRQLHPVANPEYRNPKLENTWIAARRVRFVNTGRTTRQDQSLWRPAFNLL